MERGVTRLASLVTSQNVTAPKQLIPLVIPSHGLVTSQNVTAPKPKERLMDLEESLVTSQNVTAPKLGMYES